MGEEIRHAIVLVGLVVCFTEDGRDILDEIFALVKTVTRRQLGCVHEFGSERFGAPVPFGVVVRHFNVVLTFKIRSLQIRED